ncbi:hypothetical protein ACM39_11515 [Chryseobacterium sp. FH2]|uniref:DUF4280 domain-containing protein n=1 Tax=Chryseobacterium sp. FH2 TaxID=1674291 RepID=UPI00065AC44D|nr:DUF4280 domain-containing protein [Chryseobacterium sp. FH2]KMQ67954.1 hypothetical protein ACM39_11515 [Chryseobacterium sp. FH2]
MSHKYLVCQGATCRCNFGTTPDKLKVLTQSKHYINDSEGKEKLTATHKDIGKTFEKNTFGSCAKMNNNPCQVVVTEWSGYYENITLAYNRGGKVLLEDSKATCPIGGKDCITIIKHGQTVEISKQNLKNTSAAKIRIMNPLLDLDEILDELDEQELDVYDDYETYTK